jgi:O-antigen/teichoic acid export membrane protein
MMLSEASDLPDRGPPTRIGRRDRAVLGQASVRRALPAGLLDAALASLASFIVTFYAARSLPAAGLGIYALFFNAFIMAAVVPTQLLFSPAEIGSLPYRGRHRLGLLDQSLRSGLLLTVGAAALGTLAAVAGSAGAPGALVVPLASTCVLCTAVSPVQDHVRRLLHLAGVSWRAAAMSVVQLTTVVGCLLLLSWLRVPTPWLPFGALLTANVLSLSLGLILAAERRNYEPLERMMVRDLFRFGRWLVLVGLTPAAAWFLSGVLVTHLAGAATLGYVEAARVVSMPIFVLMMGLSAVLVPRLMEAAAERRPDRARLASLPFRIIIVISGVLYLLTVGFRWRLNPLSSMLPSAYAVQGIVSLMIVGQVLQGVLQPPRAELTGVGWGGLLFRLSVAASLPLCLVAATAGVTGVFAAPLGLIAQGLVGLWLLERARRRIYVGAGPTPRDCANP